MKKYDFVILVGEKNVILNKDDQILYDYLFNMGYKVAVVDWNNNFEWNTASVVVVRSTWDYSRKFSSFIEKMRDISKYTILVNGFDIIEKNYDKHYLLNLNKLGIPIIPSLFVDKICLEEIDEFIKEQKSDEVVIKPTISAGGRNTYKVNSQNKPEIIKRIKECMTISGAIVQPFLPEVLSNGEISSIVINGKLIASVRKRPSKDNFLVQNHYGGLEESTNINADEYLFVNKVIKSIPDNAVYARIDFINTGHKIMLVELEMIEPDLFLRFHSEILDNFTRSLISIHNSII